MPGGDDEALDTNSFGYDGVVYPKEDMGELGLVSVKTGSSFSARADDPLGTRFKLGGSYEG